MRLPVRGKTPVYPLVSEDHDDEPNFLVKKHERGGAREAQDIDAAATTGDPSAYMRSAHPDQPDCGAGRVDQNFEWDLRPGE